MLLMALGNIILAFFDESVSGRQTFFKVFFFMVFGFLVYATQHGL